MKFLFKITIFGWLILLPFSVSAEVIENFDVHIDLRDDGSFTVTEDILYDFEGVQRHGIFRTIPTTHPQPASSRYKERYTDIDVRSVLMDGIDVPYDVSVPGRFIEIKIGDPNETITGLHVYTITYDVGGALFKTGDTVELYWNATGNDWQVPISSARVEIVVPEGTLGKRQTCYIGSTGSTARCDAASLGNIALFIGQNMQSGEGLTIAQSLNHNIPVNVLEKISSVWIILASIIIGGGGIAFFLYKVETKHKIRGPVIPQYEPYEDIGPMYAGMLIDNELHVRDITAGIVYLAEQGFLKIKKTEKKFLFFPISDYEIVLTKDPELISNQFLQAVFSLVFDTHARVGETITLSEIKKSYTKKWNNQQTIRELKKSLHEDLADKGYFEFPFEKTVKKIMTAVTVLVVGLLLVSKLIKYIDLHIAVVIPISIVGILVLVILQVFHKRRTRKGYEAMNHLKGFKEFLSVTGKDRFKFHNAPEKSPEQFLEYLPYAIAFGVEKDWAKVFDDIIIPNPTWYEGGAAGAFSATAFSSDMSAFSSSLGTSSGTSASSGGGSAGGGAGGGGGGSW